MFLIKYLHTKTSIIKFQIMKVIDRVKLIAYLKDHGIGAVFHYLSLHLSDYYKQHHQGEFSSFPLCDKYAD